MSYQTVLSRLETPYNSYPGTMPTTLLAFFRVSCRKTYLTSQPDSRLMDSGSTFLTATLYSMTYGSTAQSLPA